MMLLPVALPTSSSYPAQIVAAGVRASARTILSEKNVRMLI